MLKLVIDPSLLLDRFVSLAVLVRIPLLPDFREELSIYKNTT